MIGGWFLFIGLLGSIGGCVMVVRSACNREVAMSGASGVRIPGLPSYCTDGRYFRYGLAHYYAEEARKWGFLDEARYWKHVADEIWNESPPEHIREYEPLPAYTPMQASFRDDDKPPTLSCL